MPGVVLDVVVNSNSTAYTTIRDLNSIIAKSHVSNDVEQDSVNKTRYYPLMRGMVDVPTEGDPVLLFTFPSTPLQDKLSIEFATSVTTPGTNCKKTGDFCFVPKIEVWSISLGVVVKIEPILIS